MADLSELSCRSCKTVEPLQEGMVKEMLEKIGGWSVEGKKIKKSFEFESFSGSMIFLNRVAEIAEQEGHHPDISLSYNRVNLELWTHSVGGLSENDFILAAKIDKIA